MFRFVDFQFNETEQKSSDKTNNFSGAIFQINKKARGFEVKYDPGQSYNI